MQIAYIEDRKVFTRHILKGLAYVAIATLFFCTLTSFYTPYTANFLTKLLGAVVLFICTFPIFAVFVLFQGGCIKIQDNTLYDYNIARGWRKIVSIENVTNYSLMGSTVILKDKTGNIIASLSLYDPKAFVKYLNAQNLKEELTKPINSVQIVFFFLILVSFVLLLFYIGNILNAH